MALSRLLLRSGSIISADGDRKPYPVHYVKMQTWSMKQNLGAERNNCLCCYLRCSEQTGEYRCKIPIEKCMIVACNWNINMFVGPDCNIIWWWLKTRLESWYIMRAHWRAGIRRETDPEIGEDWTCKIAACDMAWTLPTRWWSLYDI